MSIKPWRIIDSRRPMPKFRMDNVELHSGKTHKAFVFEFDSWANVLALTKNNEAVLVRQYRHGVQEILLELPGGVVDKGEDPLDGAKRELLEETGYSCKNIVEVGKIYANPAIQQNTLYCYLATDVELTSPQHLDDSEEIEVVLVPLDELVEIVKAGKFLHALNIAVLYRALAHMGRIA